MSVQEEICKDIGFECEINKDFLKFLNNFLRKFLRDVVYGKVAGCNELIISSLNVNCKDTWAIKIAVVIEFWISMSSW